VLSVPSGVASWEGRWFERVDVHGPEADRHPEFGPCWLWTGRAGADGYGRFDRAGETTTAARAGWEIALGEQLPKGYGVRRYACTRRLCVNPEHGRPWIASEDIDNDRILARWNATHDYCVAGHALTHENRITIPAGVGCRACRHEVEVERAKRRRRR
jgi:hypothetical protein